MSPWDVLDVPEETADQTVIRKAYAAKVRAHPPDIDPEGFRRVREAYEWLREWARARIEPGTLDEPEETPEDPTPLAERRSRGPAPDVRDVADPAVLAERRSRPAADAVPPEPPPIPPGRETRRREPPDDARDLAAVRAAAALPKGPERDRALHAALRALADRMQTDLRLVPVWSRAVIGTVEDPGRPRLVVSYARYGDVVLDLFEAEGNVAARVFQIFRGEAAFDRLKRLAAAVLDHPGEPRHDVGMWFAYLAASVAIVAPDLARSLADRAFRGAARKDAAVPEWLDIDRLVAAGEEAKKAGAGAKAYLAARLDGTGGSVPDAEALRLVARLRPTSALLVLLLERDPELVDAALARFPRRAPRQTQAESPSWRWLFVVVGIVVGLVRVCDREEPRAPSTERIYRETEDAMRNLREKYGYDPNATPEENMRRLRERLNLPPPIEPSRPPR